MIRILLFTSLVAIATAQVLPGFSTYRADQRNSGVLSVDGPTTGDMKWLFKTNITEGDMIDNSAVIGPNGDLFFTISKFLFCVSNQGEFRWRHRAEGLFRQSTASVTSDALYIIGSNYDWGSETDNAIVMAFSLSGKRLWSYKTQHPSQFGSVNVMDNGNIVTVFNGYHVMVFSPSGNLVWEYKDLGESNQTWVDEMTPAIHDDGSILYGSKDGNVRCLSAEGVLQWALPITPYYNIQSLTIGDDGNIYASVDEGYGYTYNASVYCISRSGEVIWRYIAPAEYAVHAMTSPIYHNGNVYVVIDNYLYSLQEGKEMWRYEFYDPFAGPYTMWNSPIITKNNMLYVCGWWYVFGFDITGTESSTTAPQFTWRYAFDTYGSSTTNWGPVPTVDSDGNLYVGAYSFLYAVSEV